MVNKRFGLFVVAVSQAAWVFGSSVLETSLDRRIEIADAIFEAEVRDLRCFEIAPGGQISTAVTLRVQAVYKGDLPDQVEVIQPGGTFKGRVETDGLGPHFRKAESRLVFANWSRDGRLTIPLGDSGAPLLSRPRATPLTLTPALQRVAAAPSSASEWQKALEQRFGVRPLTSTTGTTPEVGIDDREQRGPLSLIGNATNLMTDAGGISARFSAPDRGDPIRYYVDADYLPAGMTREQAMSALGSALDAWSAASSLRFEFGGYQSFGVPAAQVPQRDGTIRIQLHDAHGYISGSGEVLGRGGNFWAMNPAVPEWTLGGNVKGNDFHIVTSGWVILQHNATFMQNVTNFTEVLAHELGHALSLGHSSDNPKEPNQGLKQALMFYTAHGDGRGARLSSFDTNVIRQVHPVDNTPPFCYDRVMDAITTPSNRKGMNVVTFPGYDPQGTNLFLQTARPTTNAGTFKVAGNTIGYDPNDFYNTERLEPTAGMSYDMIYARYLDGTNASPWRTVRVISLKADTYYEGIPDEWRKTYFGSANPNTGSNRKANQDFDADGFSNMSEYLLGTNPTNRNSNFRVGVAHPCMVTWAARPYDLYEVLATTNMAVWKVEAAVMPTNASAAVIVASDKQRQAFRVRRVP